MEPVISIPANVDTVADDVRTQGGVSHNLPVTVPIHREVCPFIIHSESI
jgi:hypothetical protein